MASGPEHGDELPRDRAALVSALDAGRRFTFLPFWGHQAAPDGRLTASCLSQWWPSPFVVAGERFETAEHWMMAGKARLFGDEARRAEILRAATPADAKKLGRQVTPFDPALWSARCVALVVEGSVAKFGSSSALRAFLLATAPAILVEASPRDVIWGIGLGPTNPAAHEPRRWRGRNLLGFALTEARARLAAAPGAI